MSEQVPTIILPRRLGRLEIGDSGRWELRGGGLNREAKSLERLANQIAVEVGFSPSLGPSPYYKQAAAITRHIKGSAAIMPPVPEQEEGVLY